MEHNSLVPQPTGIFCVLITNVYCQLQPKRVAKTSHDAAILTPPLRPRHPTSRRPDHHHYYTCDPTKTTKTIACGHAEWLVHGRAQSWLEMSSFILAKPYRSAVPGLSNNSMALLVRLIKGCCRSWNLLKSGFSTRSDGDSCSSILHIS